MSDKNKLAAKVRDAFGKGAARKLRAAGQTPAVIYGHGHDPIHIAVETHPLGLIVRHANALIELDIEGDKQLALVKDVQKNPVKQEIEHVDLLIVKKGETVEVDIPVVLEGEPFAGTTAMQVLQSLLVQAPATDIPEHYVVDVEGLEEGAQITAGEVKLGKDVELLTEADELVAHVIVPIVDTETTADVEEEEPESENGGEEEGDAAEGEADAEGDE